ncbi:adenosylcobalamin-dependent ribonucleoside-diphosphate reductase [Candidatus Pacearchaeota archaeon]|nr:adenosylcobalamin-dependent ribonucleoside-diphosphate reductase [Candidatus Pacearchaeota archaeon]
MKKVDLSANALEVARSRYFMNEDEDWETCVQRVSTVIATPDVGKKQKFVDDFQNMIYNMDFLPGGRILRNSGRPRGSLFNCYHLPIGDSIEEIGQLYKDALTLWSEGGGVGVNFSPLRPRNDAIHGKGGVSSGLVSFMAGADFISRLIESGGSRRAAAIGHIEVSHPEVLDFIDAKLKIPNVGKWLREDTPEEIIKFVKEQVDVGALRHFNISVVVNNAFLETVETDGDWTFKFKQKSYGTVKARDIFNKIVTNMVQCAEPGLINWTNFAKNNSYYFAPVLGTNPCGETTLGPNEACDLGSLVLPNFITGTVNTNWKKLENIIKLAVRFLDNVIDVNKYVLKDIDINAHNTRRIGIGVIGLAEYLFAKGVKYGSDRAVVEVERVMRFIRDAAYNASVELAIEKGAFPKFEASQYGKASFIRKLPATLRSDIKKYGTRNCSLMALAPTGTISLLTGYQSAIEPLFAKAYLRSDRVSSRMYVHPKYEELIKSGADTPDWFVDAFDLEPKDHFEMQVACQKFCDAAVSKTINLPKETTTEDLSTLLLEYMYDLKGVTVYTDGSRPGQILNKVSDEKAREYLKENEADHNLEENDILCVTGSCEI